MKNLQSILSSLFSLSILFFVSCGERTQTQDAAAESKIAVEAPEQIISMEEAKMFYENYSDRRASLIQKFEDSINISKQDTTKFDVARYTYYDYKTIKQYLDYIEQEAAKAGVEISTLRFYYSNYPDQGSFSNGKKIDHPRQNSVFILPTLNQDGDEFGFYTEEDGQGGLRAVLFDYKLDNINLKEMGLNNSVDGKSYAGFMNSSSAISAPTIFNGGSMVLNQGGAAPPPYK